MNNTDIHNNFQCIHCNKQITVHQYMGTSHRNHCPFCLWSKHVDKEHPGDRISTCHGPMEPVGLTFKHEGTDKYGKHKQGEIMIIHLCQMCGKININRIAGDDDENNILSLLNPEAISKKILTSVSDSGIELLGKQNEDEVKKQLFGIQRI